MSAGQVDNIIDSTRATRTCPQCGNAFLTGGRGNPRHSQRHCSRRCHDRGTSRLPFPRQMSPEECAYVAGLFDGEGCVLLWRRGRGASVGYRRYLRCTVSNCHRPVLEWVQRTTGTGSILKQRDATEKHSTSWTWVCNGTVAAAFLEQLLPYLIVKRDRAHEGIEMSEEANRG